VCGAELGPGDRFLWRMRKGGQAMKKTALTIVCAFVFLAGVVAWALDQSPMAQPRDLDSRLQASVENGDIKGVRAALGAGANPNVVDKDGYSPLHVAVREDRHDIAAVLLSKGADVNVRSPFGETALHLVQSTKTAELLLSKGADVNPRDTEFGMTPLFNADAKVSAVLLSHGADIEATSKEGHTPLAWSAYWDNLEKSRFLLSKGARVNAGAGKTKTALHIAANWGRIELAQLLIDHGADVNARDDSGWTPLHWAAFEGGPEMVRFLISRGAAADARTLKPWAIFPAGSTVKDIEGGGRAQKTPSPLEQLKEKGGKWKQ
jgi:ankyrin repeat protein